MYNSSGIIPTRFLCLIAHLTACISLLWGIEETVMSCLPPDHSLEFYLSQRTWLTIGLGLTIGMIAFELIGFLLGITTFHSSSSLMSIACHSAATLTLAYFVFDTWQCGWFWVAFGLCSVPPALIDTWLMIDALFHGKW